MNSDEMISRLHEVFDGRDPLAEAHIAMKKMDSNELIKLVLIAANRIGIIMKGGDYDDALDAALHLCHGVDLIFSAYDNAWMEQQVNTTHIAHT